MNDTRGDSSRIPTKRRSITAGISRHRPRAGTAPLEFVMVLPVILFVLAAILWVGVAMNTQAELTVETRNDAWKRRDGGPSEDAFHFDRQNRIESRMERPVEFLRIFSGFAPASARHAVLAGSWDHLQVPMNDQPNWPLYSRLGIEGNGDQLQQFLGGLGDLQSQFPSLQDMIDNQLEPVLGDSQQLNGSQGQSFQAQDQQKLQTAVENERQELAKVEGQIKQLDAQIRANQGAQAKQAALLQAVQNRLKQKNLSSADRKNLQQETTEINKQIADLNQRGQGLQSQDQNLDLRKQQITQELDNVNSLNTGL